MDKWLYIVLSLIAASVLAAVATLEVAPPLIFVAALLIAAGAWTFADRMFPNESGAEENGEGYSGEDESEGDPVGPETTGTYFAPGFARTLIENIPGPVMAVSEKGRVTYYNAAAGQEFPQLKNANHFANVIRAPAFVAAVTETLKDGVARSTRFTTFDSTGKLFLANINRTDPDEESDFGTQAVIQLEDYTLVERTERQRSDFIANASHELRTPLASIIGYIETLQNHARDDPEAQERFLAIMARQAERMQRLVDDLMSLGRIEMNQHVKPREALDPISIMSDCASAMLPLAEQDGAVIEVDLDPSIGIEVMGDRDQLSQVFTNLLDNALKYGGEASRVKVSSVMGASGGKIGITVADSGPGIPRDKIPRLTERFYRVNVNQSRNRGGTGLGLAIVKHILTRHGGRLEIASEEGRGSRFTVWLPLANRKESAA